MKMFLHREELEKMLEIFQKFPDVDVCEITQDSTSGIGSIVAMRVFAEIAGVPGRFEVEISNVENW